MVCRDAGQRALGHAGRKGIGRVPNDRNAAAVLDGPQPGAAIVEHAGQDHADHTRAMLQRCRLEQRVNGGPRMVFLGPPGKPDDVSLLQHVVVWRRDVNHPWPGDVAGNGRDSLVGATGADQFPQLAGMGANVLHKKDGRRKITRQDGSQIQDGVEASCRCAHDDDWWSR